MVNYYILLILLEVDQIIFHFWLTTKSHRKSVRLFH